MNNQSFPKYHIPKGIYDKTNYQTQHMTDTRTQNLPMMGDLQDQNHGKDNIHPIMIPYSRQIYKANYMPSNLSPSTINNVSQTFDKDAKEEPFKLGDTYTRAHGSNINLYSANAVLPNYQLDLIKDDVSSMFRQLHKNPEVQDRLTRLEETANPIVNPEDIEGTDRGIIPKKINEYDKPDFRDNNFISASEYVAEYNVYINSSDRDCVAYPDPFNYRVEFNPVAGTKQAYINRVFENVKYVDLQNVIVPRTYHVLCKATKLIINTGTVPAFVTAFTSTTEGSAIVTHSKYTGIFVYNTVTYYFTYYVQNISGNNYWFSNNEIYLDDSFTQKVTVPFPDTNALIIATYTVTGALGAPLIGTYTYNAPVLSVARNWILIDHNTTDKKIKFSFQDDIYENTIDQVYEFTYDVANNIVANSFKEYVLAKGKLDNDRFLLLNIPEIETKYEYATDQSISKAYCILFPDYINGDYYYMNTAYHEKLFDRGVLGVVNKMSISLKHGSGTPIKTGASNIIDYDITTPKDKCICEYDSITGERVRNYQCMHSYLRHQTFEKLQNSLLFKIGTIEGKHNNINIQN